MEIFPVLSFPFVIIKKKQDVITIGSKKGNKSRNRNSNKSSNRNLREIKGNKSSYRKVCKEYKSPNT